MARASGKRRSETKSTVDPEEVARFAALADSWWDPGGPLGPLHRLNPTRIAYVRDRLCAHFGRDATSHRPFEGLKLLDIGCGGGLLAEPMARLGARVVGADVSEENIRTARAHAAESELAIDYRVAAAEELALGRERFDALLAMEVVEHVADLNAFLAACGALVKPGGAMAVATLNRTLKAFALAVVGAEYIMGWLPRGTHNWERFVRPSELARRGRPHGLSLAHLTGVAFHPLTGEWDLSRDTGVNYMGFLVKESRAAEAKHGTQRG